MPEPTDDPTANDRDADLVRRLDTYLTGLDHEPLPPRLEHTSLADVRAAHGPAFFSGTRAVALAGAAATVALVLAVLMVGRGPGGDQIDTTHGSPSSAPGVAGTDVPGAPTTAEPGGDRDPGPGGTLPGTDGTGDPTPTSDPGATSTTSGGTDAGASSTVTTGAGGPSTTKPPIATTTAPGNGPTTTKLPTPTSAPTTTTTTAPPSDELFYDDFATDPNYASPVRWSADSGSFQVKQSGATKYAVNTGGGTESRVSRGDPGWTDLTVTAAVRVSAATERVGLAVRYVDEDNYVFCKVDRPASKLYLGVFQNGSVGSTVERTLPTVPLGSEVTMTVTADGGSLSCRWNGVTVTKDDGTFPSGKVGILAHNGDGAVTKVRATRVP